MNKATQGKLRTILLVCLAVNAGCNKKKVETTAYYYYPLQNIYYDLNKKIFLYSIDSARTWEGIADSSNRTPLLLGARVELPVTAGDIYLYNAVHRKLYGGRLLNIISRADTSRLSAEPDVHERPSRPKITQPPVTKETTDKPKGIKKILNKIFGKK